MHEESIEKKNITKADQFIIKRYKDYILRTISRLGNRDNDLDDFYWKDNEFNISRLKDKIKHTIYTDESSLFKCFLTTLKEDNIHETDPFLFRKALGEMTDEEINAENCNRIFEYSEEGMLYIEKVKINKKPLLRIIF